MTLVRSGLLSVWGLLLAASLAANPDGAGQLWGDAGGNLLGHSESGAWSNGAVHFADHYQLKSSWWLDLRVTAPVAESLSLQAGTGFSRAQDEQDETANGGAGHWERDWDDQAHSASLGIILYPAAWFRGPWTLAKGDPDGWLGWPSLSAIVQHGYANQAYNYPLLVGYLPQSPYTVTSNDWVGQFQVAVPVASSATLSFNYDHGYQYIWNNPPYSGDQRDDWEDYMVGLTAYVPLFHDDGPAFPKLGRPGTLRVSGGYYWENLLSSQVLWVRTIQLNAGMAIADGWAVDLTYMHVMYQTQTFDQFRPGAFTVTASQPADERLQACLRYSFGDADPHRSAPPEKAWGPPPALDAPAETPAP